MRLNYGLLVLLLALASARAVENGQAEKKQLELDLDLDVGSNDKEGRHGWYPRPPPVQPLPPVQPPLPPLIPFPPHPHQCRVIDALNKAKAKLLQSLQTARALCQESFVLEKLNIRLNGLAYHYGARCQAPGAPFKKDVIKEQQQNVVQALLAQRRDNMDKKKQQE